MFTTIDQVEELTGYAVTQETIIQSQAIIESYVGRVEAEVNNAQDLMILGRATAYQAAYMRDDTDKVFEQMSIASILQYGQQLTFKSGDIVSPWVAPLAVIACKRLSWARSRSVKTGSLYYSAPDADDWRRL